MVLDEARRAKEAIHFKDEVFFNFQPPDDMRDFQARLRGDTPELPITKAFLMEIMTEKDSSRPCSPAWMVSNRRRFKTVSIGTRLTMYSWWVVQHFSLHLSLLRGTFREGAGMCLAALKQWLMVRVHCSG